MIFLVVGGACMELGGGSRRQEFCCAHPPFVLTASSIPTSFFFFACVLGLTRGDDTVPFAACTTIVRNYYSFACFLSRHSERARCVVRATSTWQHVCGPGLDGGGDGTGQRTGDTQARRSGGHARVALRVPFQPLSAAGTKRRLILDRFSRNASSESRIVCDTSFGASFCWA